MPDYKYLDIVSDELAGIIANETTLAIDTEFMREKTYYAQLCLVQIATKDVICCADPLISTDDALQQRIWSELLDHCWVVHSARQDLEVIYQTAGRMPKALFDTQIAAGLLGYAPQLGYANLVEELFDKKLAKSHTRADWSRRPLSNAAIEYAAEDVEYLLPACDSLTERLVRLDRLEWAQQDSADLLLESLYQNDPQMAVERLKGARNLHGAARAAAERLAAWREERAISADRPRQWILRDAVLLEIAVARPSSRKALATIPGLAARSAQRWGDKILEILARSADDTVDYRPPPRPDQRQKAILKKMQATVAAHAAELDLAAEVIAPKKDLSSALNGSRQHRVFRGWRKELVGAELLAMLDEQ